MSTLSVLTNLGLTKNASLVYEALLSLKKGTVIDIARKSRILRPAVYDSVERLQKLGLITRVIEGKKSCWIIENPKLLYKLIEEKKTQLDQFIPELTERFKESAYKPKIKFYEGIDGVKRLHEETLGSKEKTIRSFGTLGIINKMLHSSYSKHYWEERVKKKLQVRVLDSIENKELYKGDKRFSEISNIRWMREVRFIPKPISIKMFIMAFDEHVLLFSEAREGFSISFESPAFADTVKGLFDFLWSISERLK